MGNHSRTTHSLHFSSFLLFLPRHSEHATVIQDDRVKGKPTKWWLVGEERCILQRESNPPRTPFHHGSFTTQGPCLAFWPSTPSQACAPSPSHSQAQGNARERGRNRTDWFTPPLPPPNLSIPLRLGAPPTTNTLLHKQLCISHFLHAQAI